MQAAVPLDVEGVRRALALRRIGCAIELVASCGSTNTELLERARAGLCGPQVLVADRQTAGRGRRGARWLSGPGASLTFSMRHVSARSGSALGLVPLAAGLATARALEALGAHGVKLKWPNDLVLEAGKLGGILVESARQGGAMALVIGIGLNLSGAQALRLELEREVADLTGLPGGAPPREALLIEMVSALHGVLRDFEAGEDSRLLEAWARYDLLRGRAVEIALEEGTLHGIARGVSPVGALILEAGGALREVYAGEARVLRR